MGGAHGRGNQLRDCNAVGNSSLFVRGPAVGFARLPQAPIHFRNIIRPIALLKPSGYAMVANRVFL